MLRAGEAEANEEEDVRFVCSAQKKLVFRKIDLIPKDTVLQKGQKPPEESLPALSVLNLDHNPLRCVPYSLHHRRLISVRLSGCQFDELHRSIKWTDTNYHILRVRLLCSCGAARIVVWC